MILKNIYKKVKTDFPVLTIILDPIKSIYDFYKFHLINEEIFIKKEFHKKFGYKLNLKNPKTFNEKIQWLKLNDRTPLHTLCADKFLVRDFVKEEIGEEYLIPILYHTSSAKGIAPDILPDYPVIIKTNHDSGNYFVIKDKNNQDWSSIRASLKKSLNNNYYYKGKEWQYKNIKPLIIVEKLLTNTMGELPLDYKIHCFNGKAKFIQVDIDRISNHTRNIYDKNWNKLDLIYEYPNGRDVDSPLNLSKMLILAEDLAKSFIFARIDFYEFEKKIFFGEITFHPECGFGKIEPDYWNEKIGKWLKLSLNA